MVARSRHNNRVLIDVSSTRLECGEHITGRLSLNSILSMVVSLVAMLYRLNIKEVKKVPSPHKNYHFEIYFNKIDGKVYASLLNSFVKFHVYICMHC